MGETIPTLKFAKGCIEEWGGRAIIIDNLMMAMAEKMTKVEDALVKGQAQCNDDDEGELKSPLDIVKQGSSIVGVHREPPTLSILPLSVPPTILQQYHYYQLHSGM